MNSCKAPISKLMPFKPQIVSSLKVKEMWRGTWISKLMIWSTDFPTLLLQRKISGKCQFTGIKHFKKRPLLYRIGTLGTRTILVRIIEHKVSLEIKLLVIWCLRFFSVFIETGVKQTWMIWPCLMRMLPDYW